MATSKQSSRFGQPQADLSLDGDFLDLPLSAEPDPEPESLLAPAVPRRPGSGGPPRGGHPPAGRPPGQPRRGRGPGVVLWLLLLLAFPVGAAVGYYLNLDPPVLALATDLVDFGEVRLGRAGEPLLVAVANRGQEPLAITEARLVGAAAADFQLVADGCAGSEVEASGSCALRLLFQPSASGRRRAQLRLAGNAVNAPQSLPLVGVGVAPRLGFDPPRLELGQQTVGGATPAATLALVSTGTAPLAVRQVALEGLGAADFVVRSDACSGRRLAPGERCAVEVFFVPTAAGERRASVRVASDAAEQPAVPWLVGIGLPQEPALALAPERIDFGTVLAGEASPGHGVTITNDGSGPLTVHSLAAGGGFRVVGESCSAAAVAPGGSCEVTLAFVPTAEGTAQEALEIRHSAGGGVHRVVLAGTGTTPRVFLDPLRLSFGEVPVRQLSQPRALRLVSSGSGALTLGGAELAGADAASFTLDRQGCPAAKLAPGKECSMSVRFRPRRDGPHRAELVIRHSAGAGGHRLPINGLGTSPRLGLEPGRLDFGEVAVGTSADRRLTLTNSGRAELAVRRLRLAGVYGADFTLHRDRCARAALGPGERCTVEVRFAPSTPGTRSARLLVEHGAGGQPREVAIAASAILPPVPELHLAPAVFHFPDRRVGERGPISTLTLKNVGSGRLELGEPRLAGDHPGDFGLVAGSCASYVAPGGSCTLGVRFAPRVEGPRRAVLMLSHNAEGGPRQVELLGYGSVPPPVP